MKGQRETQFDTVCRKRPEEWNPATGPMEIAQISLDKPLGLKSQCEQLNSAMSFLPSMDQLLAFSRFFNLDRYSRSHRMRNILAGAFLVLSLSLSACETTVSTKLPNVSVSQSPIVLSPGDVVKVTFPGQPDYSQSQKIGTDGRINLPLVGEVTASGNTVSQLQQKLAGLYRSQLSNSEVIVTLESRVVMVVIAGAVQKPAKYTFDRPTTIFQAVMEAGGPDQFGTLAKVKLTRLVNGQQQTEVLDLRPILQGHPTNAVYVQPGDVIVVGENPF